MVNYWSRGPSVRLDYWKDPGATALPSRMVEYPTGDLGYRIRRNLYLKVVRKT
jgi:hypothetical protein